MNLRRKINRVSRKKAAALMVAAISFLGAALVTSGAFTAQTRNPGNVFASGTLVLSNTKQSQTACLSTAGGTTDTNVNNACNQLLTGTVQKPGDTAFGRVTLTNLGSLNASALQMYVSSCVTANASGQSYFGTGDMCANLSIYVQQYSDSGFTTKSSCLYGGGTATVCAFDPAKTPATLASTYPVGTPLGLGPLAPGAAEYYEIVVQLPSTAGNNLQGRQATFDVTWLLAQ